jgi:allantoinase
MTGAVLQSDAERIRNRLDHQPINSRPRRRLPGGARIAVWTIVNVEVCSPDAPMPRAVLPPPMGQPLLPDVPNWAWREYGMRVGFGRFVEALDARGLKASFAVNGAACEIYPAF